MKQKTKQLIMTLVALLALTTGAWAAGSDALAGVFTINASGDKVQFSKGNLQAVFSAAGTDCTWQFAENQWDCSGYGGGTGGNYLINGNGSVSAPGTVDLFGWSTSATKFGILRSTNNNDFSGDFVDWGVNIGEGWRTLSADEWKYLLDNHTYGFATVCGVKGIFVLPDGCSLTINTAHNNFNNNTIDAAEWASTYAPVGVLFLPAHGFLHGNDYNQHQISAYYWSSTAAATDGQKYAILYAYQESSNRVYNESKIAFNASSCFSVRLVRKAATATPVDLTWDATANTATLTNGMPAGNVTVSVEYYDLATLADKGLTAAEDAAAKTEAPLAVVADGAVTGGTLMYYVAPDGDFTQADAIALAETAWSADIPTAETIGAAGTYYVWYYIKGDAEHSDTDPQRLAVTVLPEPTYDVTLNDEGLSTDEAAAWKVAKGTDDPAAFPLEGVKKGETVTVTYSGTKKVLGVKAEKKAAGTPLDNTTTAWTAGTYAVPAGGLTYSAAITVSGDVTLILTDGETLTLNKGISLASGATLTIQGNGTMNVNGTNGADINTQEMDASADSGTEAISGSGTVVLTSGTLTATGGKGGNVNDYYPECKGGHGAAGISCTLIVNGGTVTATGGNGGSLTNGLGPMGVAGNGGAGISGALTVNGGTLTATGGDGGAKSKGQEAQAGTNGRGISSTWTAGTGITFSDSANGTSWTTNSGTSSTQKYVKAE